MSGRNALALLVLLAAGCAPPGGGAAGYVRPTAASCAARGRVLGGGGMALVPICVTLYPDAGNACSDDSDCAGRCILESNNPERNYQTHPVGAEAQGQCQRQDPLFGCYSEIVGGRITPPICVD